MAGSVFTKIIQGELPCHKVAEDDKHLAFLDISPLTEGHTLVIPKREENHIFDLSDEETAALHIFARKVANAIRQAIDCKRVAMEVIGLEVPHAHIHLIPVNQMSDTLMSNAKLDPGKEKLEKTAAAIRALL